MDCIKNMDVKISILTVETAQLRPNPWNTNVVGAQNFDKLKNSIDRLGFFKPILVRDMEDGTYQILGGEHRWRAAIEQGMASVPVTSVGVVEDNVAKQMSLVDNERYGEDDAVELQRLIESIQAEIDYSLAEIAPYDEELTATLARESRIDLEELGLLGEEGDSVAEADPRETKERLGVEHQTMRFKVSFDTAEGVTEIVKTIIREQGIKTGSDMEDAGEALVWLTQYYKDVVDGKVV
ncbi:ParB/RepB/Spo0J family partition protein [Klebsiella michiganensis]|jgi:ParB/RepB/Spo0J family partition protein|nr:MULTISPECIES: ParB/RepB/Spo0J family partition protein [Klebsiella/Raoultella group]APM29218.1 chromosome partitioning protein ParB [Klebsiella oxytoca]UVY41858.1 MAG: ParB-like nuclease domain [Bacteriophage sp.]ELK6574814.1 ParB N-terminal domain-containing protein [Klebsiella michiganensis]MBM7227245.1 ParB N-terminal domain-containing protein [Klebsiella michiganensis]QLS23531.1 ParB N-terminal domain-containing protein [Klebsiella michiganensis]